MTLCSARPEEDPAADRPTPADDTLADLACGLLRVLGARDRYHAVMARRHKVSVSALDCLCYCRLDGPQPSGQLASLLGVSPSAVTAMVESLVRRGLATRTRAPHDRRVIMVRATEAGAAIVDELTATVGRHIAAVIDPHTVVGTLTQVSASLDACAREAIAPAP